MARGAPNSVQPGYTRSWMSSQAQRENLLYVSNANNNTVTVYGLTNHKLVGMLSNVYGVYGVCADTSGNVWAVGYDKVVEYAHAGTKPIRTISAPNTDLYDCAVDPTTGNLAVTNWGVNNWWQGDVLVYAPGSSYPTAYNAEGVWFYYDCTYDAKGNLYVDGWDSYLNGYVAVGELAKNGKALKKIPMIPTFQPPLIGGVRWDGQYLAILDWESIALYSVKGGYAHLKGFAPLTTAWPIGTFWLVDFGSGKRQIIAPDTAGYNGAVQYWKYPAAGPPIATITQKINGPWGVTVSLAQ